MIVPRKAQEQWIVISVALATFMSKVDTFIVNMSLPSISRHFNADICDVSRVVIAYLLVSAGTLMIFGKLADRVGLKKIFLMGYYIFAGGSLLCGVAPDLNILVAARCIQGIGGAMLSATGLAIISEHIPRENTGWAYGIFSSAGWLGAAIGAPLGGIISGYFSWQWIFLINVPIGLAAAYIAARIVPQEKQESIFHIVDKRPRFDFAGAALSFLWVTFLIIGQYGAKEAGWLSPSVIPYFIASIVLFGAFILQEIRCARPLVDLKLFRERRFTFAIIATLFIFMLFAGNNFIIPFYLMMLKGLKSDSAGWIILTYSLIYILAAPLIGRMADRIRPDILCSMAILAASSASFLFAWTLHFKGLAAVFFYIVFLALSLAMFISPNNKMIMDMAPRDRTGIVAGMTNMVKRLSMVFGICLFETIFSLALPSAGTSPFQMAVPYEVLVKGFQNTYIIGGIMGSIALLFSLAVMSLPDSQGTRRT